MLGIIIRQRHWQEELFEISVKILSIVVLKALFMI